MKEKTEYEIRREEREKVRENERMQAKMERIKKSFVRYGLWIVIVVAIGYGLFLLARTAGPDGEDFSVAYSIQGRDHIANGATHPPYNSNPPSSGSHYAAAARGGFYEEPLSDEQVIHSLEHGDIWIAYHPDISGEAKETLESFAGQYVVVSPRAANEGDVSLVAWGKVDTFDIENEFVDEGRIRDFISRYDNRGPEKVRGIQTGHGGF